MLEHASGSLLDPGRPPAAAGGLGSQEPDLVLGPRQPLDSGELQHAFRRDAIRSFGMRSKVCIDWAASAVKPDRRSLNCTSTRPTTHAARPRLPRLSPGGDIRYTVWTAT